MSAIAEYIISITSAALVCGCLKSFFQSKSTVSSVLKLLCGIFLSLIALQPLMNIKLSDLNELALFDTEYGMDIAAQAQVTASAQQRAYISERCVTYIAQKAAELGCDLDIRVYTDEDPPYVPNGVRLVGSISPNARGQLAEWIRENLAIGTEDQEWIG